MAPARSVPYADCGVDPTRVVQAIVMGIGWRFRIGVGILRRFRQVLTGFP